MDIYDIGDNIWSEGGLYPFATEIPHGVAYGNKIYSWSGYNIDLSTTTNDLYFYDTDLNTWNATTSGGRRREGGTSVINGSKIYFWGGRDYAFNATNTVDIFDIETDTWSEGSSGGTPRSHHTAVLYGDKIYFWGGFDGSYAQLNSIDIYDISDDSWTTGNSGGTARVYHSSVIYGDKIYSWGGNDDFGYFDTMDIYDMGDNSWSVGNPATGYERIGHSQLLMVIRFTLIEGMITLIF